MAQQRVLRAATDDVDRVDHHARQVDRLLRGADIGLGERAQDAAHGLGRAHGATSGGTDTFATLHGLTRVQALLTGGRLDDRTGALGGPLACRSAAQLAVHTFFASAAALKPGPGALESMDEAEVKRAIAGGADRVVLADDASKLGGRGIAVGLDWDRIEVLVTELDPSDERLAPYRHLARLL